MRLEGRIREIEAHGGSQNNMVSQIMPMIIALMQGGNDKSSEMLQMMVSSMQNQSPQRGLMEALSVVEAAKRIGSDREPSFLETLAGVAEPAFNAFAATQAAKSSGGGVGQMTADHVINAVRQNPNLAKQLFQQAQNDPEMMQTIMSAGEGEGEQSNVQDEPIQFGEGPPQ